MEFKEVKELIELINKSDLRSFELTLGAATVKMSKNSQDVAITATPKAATVAEATTTTLVGEAIKEIATTPKEEVIAGNVVKAPIVGTFYASAAPDKADFVKVGDSVKKGDVLCIVEAMKVMNEVVSEFDGVVKAVLVEKETLVEYGQPLFTIG